MCCKNCGPDNPVVAALPGQGWQAAYTNPDGELTHFTPIIGWLIYEDGDIQPIETRLDGEISYITHMSNFKCLIPPGEDPYQVVEEVDEGRNAA